MELVERGGLLEALIRHREEACRGQGALVFLGGEAGVGKTVLVDELTRASNAERVWTSACDPMSTPRALGPLFDIAAVARGDLERLLREGANPDRIFMALHAELSAMRQGTLIVIEDAHWADAATLDLLRYFGRRLSSLRALMVVTYRDDEVSSRHPLRVVLGNLATAPSVHRLVVPRLSADGVREMCSGRDVDVDAIYRRTQGNPFFVVETLAVGSHELPDTVRDAVLARVAQLGDHARATLDAAAVIGPRVDAALLVEIAGAHVDVESCVAVGLLANDAGTLAFRHELTRDAILSVLPADRKLALHGLALRALRERRLRPEDFAALAHHAEGASDASSVWQFSVAAAKHAASLRAYREAAAQYARALRLGVPPGEREEAEVLEAYAHVAYLLDQHQTAVDARSRAIRIWTALGDSLRVGENLSWLTRVHYYGGDTQAANASLRAARAQLETSPEGRELAWAYSSESQFLQNTGQNTTAVEYGLRALELARQLGDVAIEAHALNNIGTARGQLSSGATGWDELLESLELAKRHGLEEDVGRAFVNLADVAVACRDLERATRWLDEGIRRMTEHGQEVWTLHMRGTRALLAVRQGRLDDAADSASYLRRPNISRCSRLEALPALGYVRALRGDPDVWPLLDESIQHALDTPEFQRLAPPRVARAAAAWLAGDDARALSEAQLGFDLALERRDPWYAGELACWVQRAGGRVTIPDWVVEPYRVQLASEWRSAAAAWREMGCELDAAFAELDGGDEESLRAAHTSFERMNARAAVTKIALLLRQLGARAIPRGPRKSTRANAAGLTDREVAVLQQLFTGLRNAEIARRLHISTKTVDHHISSILAKLDVRNRTEAVRRAVDLGLTPA